MAKISTRFLAKSVGLAAGLMVICGAARSEELRAYAGRTIALKDMRGTIYYAPNGDSFDVVVTLDSDGHPVRFVSSLKTGQATTVSTPGAVGETATTVEIKRDGDRLLVVDRPRQRSADATGSISADSRAD